MISWSNCHWMVCYNVISMICVLKIKCCVCTGNHHRVSTAAASGKSLREANIPSARSPAGNTGVLHPLIDLYFPMTAEDPHFRRLLVPHKYNYNAQESVNRTLMCEEYPYRSKGSPSLKKCKRFPTVSC